MTQSLGYLSQRFSLYGDLSIDENIGFFAEIHGLSMRDPAIKSRRERLLDLTQLTKFRSRLADQLSGGMKQKLALACTLVHEPKIILLDEPTTGVDPVSRREFWKLLSEFLAQGITILMATPYLDEAERCSRVALLHEGGLIALDTPANLRSSLPGQVMEVIASDRNRATRLLESLTGVADVQLFGERAHVRLEPGSALSDPQRLAAELRAAGVQVESHPPRASVSRGRVYRPCDEGNEMKRLLLATIFCLAGAGPANAQTALTLSEAIARGLDASHRVAELVAREDAARAVEEQRESATRPQLSLMASYTRTNHVEEFGVPAGTGGVRIIYPDIPDNVRSRDRPAVADLHGRPAAGADTGRWSRSERHEPGSRSRPGGSQT